LRTARHLPALEFSSPETEFYEFPPVAPARVGSLTSTYRVVQTYNFLLRAESENKRRKKRVQRVSVIKTNFLEGASLLSRGCIRLKRRGNGLIKLQRAHDGCLGANRRRRT
jgi:hypothetical protein